MPLNENQRGVFVDDIKENVDFFYEGFDFQVEVHRHGEGFSEEHPNILIKFLPANRKKFQSLGDHIGKQSGRFHQFGYCHLEVVSFHIYCNEYHETENGDYSVSGRILGNFLAEQCLNRVLKSWESILKYYGASFDRKDSIPIILDNSTYDEETATKIYNYDFEMILRTQLRWDKVPDDYNEDEDVAESAVVHIDPQGDQNYRKTIIINTGS